MILLDMFGIDASRKATIGAVLYACVAVLCLVCAGKINVTPGHRVSAGIWRFCGFLLSILSAITLLQADIRVTGWLRDLAVMGGWYESRRTYQMATLLAVTAFVGGATVLHARQFPSTAHSVASSIALGAVAALFAVTVLRSISYHYTDQILDMRVHFATVGQYLRLAAVAAILLGAGHELFVSIRPPIGSTRYV